MWNSKNPQWNWFWGQLRPNWSDFINNFELYKWPTTSTCFHFLLMLPIFLYRQMLCHTYCSIWNKPIETQTQFENVVFYEWLNVICEIEVSAWNRMTTAILFIKLVVERYFLMLHFMIWMTFDINSKRRTSKQFDCDEFKCNIELWWEWKNESNSFIMLSEYCHRRFKFHTLMA